ncbi:translation initiation factor [Frigoriflavimonas asaccharolytica]|uniref:Translation initiation factor 1 n=1 Tax=Frigoriflavimonas asaccharolytica TaxID=2735899 RepID=A0A8J8K8X4_9FLAO|nr:translation initiation factor [Frigoriflavimonas asaccharolytica]NRS93016.1 translation initiation factor 1 [Frigoriflavimonas asaccharolytica]
MDIRDQLQNLFPTHEEQDFELPSEFGEEKFEQIEPLVCKFEKKGRNGKPVTIIEGFEGNAEELKSISKKIKIKLGIGGSEKDGIIIIQGDNRDKIMLILKEMGYKTKRVGG